MGKYGKTVERFQMHCPKCGHEFIWAQDPIEREQERIGSDIADLQTRLTLMKETWPPEKLSRMKTYLGMKARMAALIQDAARLKQIKKNNHRVTEQVWHAELKEALKDRYGEEAYARLIEDVRERLKPKHIEQLMKERP